MAITINGTSGISGVDGSATTPALQGSDTNTGLSFGTDEVSINTGGSTRATVDSSGRLLVGSTSQSASSRLTVQSNTSSSTGEAIVSLQRGQAATAIGAIGDRLGTINFTDNADNKFASISGAVDAALSGGGGDYAGRLIFSTTTDNTSTLTERMRIDSAGLVAINATSKQDASPVSLVVRGEFPDTPIEVQQDSTSTHNAITFRNSNGLVGNIRTSGSSTSFNTSSDYRLKENVVDLDGAITRVKQLAPKRFNFIADADTTVDGFLAHEAQAVVPEAVTGTHNEVDDDGNAVMQGIDQSKLVPLLTAALQEAIGKIEALETRVAQLEGGTN